jgi:predicted nucleic acid-binding Zn ribbon protein
MIFPFQCQKCSKSFDEEFPIGKAPRVTPCPHCKGNGKRIYDGMCVAVKIGGAFCHSSTFGEQMKARNMQAAQRMKGRKAPVRLAAMDHGGGDVREVKAK